MKDKFGAEIYSKDLRLCIFVNTYSVIRKQTHSIQFSVVLQFFMSEYNLSQLSKERNKWVCSKKKWISSWPFLDLSCYFLALTWPAGLGI